MRLFKWAILDVKNAILALFLDDLYLVDRVDVFLYVS